MGYLIYTVLGLNRLKLVAGDIRAAVAWYKEQRGHEPFEVIVHPDNLALAQKASPIPASGHKGCASFEVWFSLPEIAPSLPPTPVAPPEQEAPAPSAPIASEPVPAEPTAEPPPVAPPTTVVVEAKEPTPPPEPEGAPEMAAQNTQEVPQDDARPTNKNKRVRHTGGPRGRPRLTLPVAQIMAMHAAGVSAKDIAAKVGTYPMAVSRVLARENGVAQ